MCIELSKIPGLARSLILLKPDIANGFFRMSTDKGTPVVFMRREFRQITNRIVRIDHCVRPRRNAGLRPSNRRPPDDLAASMTLGARPC
jgi:hypothetical protein